MASEASENDYKALMSEIIAKQAVILGPDIAVLKARNVEGLTVDDQGKVTAVVGDGDQIAQKLIDEYVALSGEIVRAALGSVLKKYPHASQHIS